jgi:hypothetical protein
MACLLVEELEAQERTKAKRKRKKANPSTPQQKRWGLPFDKLKAPSIAERLTVDPERRFFTPPLKPGQGAAEWVNLFKAIILPLKKTSRNITAAGTNAMKEYFLCYRQIGMFS